jgi:hypothetical protein
MSVVDLTAVASLTLPGLREAWKRRWGEAPKFRSRDLMSRAMAYRLQVEASAPLPAARRRQLAELAMRFQNDRRFTPAPVLQLKPGSAIVREWGGVRHEVVATDTGFAYAGEAFSSLSKVARRITGTAWNGQVFFGLKPRPGAKP